CQSGSAERADIAPAAMSAASQRRKQQQQLPAAFDFEAVDVQQAIVRRGALLYGHSATIKAPIANRHLHGFNGGCLAAMNQRGAERPTLPQNAQRGKGITQHAPALFRLC
ncbi:hypothetical protein COLO4_02504, partial [Corchorus olitorius]